MSETLTEKIERIIFNNSEYGGCERSFAETAAEIAAMIEAERKPDTLTVPEAVERLVAYFEKATIFADSGNREWLLHFNLWGNVPAPSYIDAMKNGSYKPAAVKVGLEDLFVTILEGDEK